jgi:broad specificity phosphatase PhoE
MSRDIKQTGDDVITRLIIVRHAEAEGNKNRVFHGWTDSEITEKGHIQAMHVAERLKDTHIDILYSSSLKRCVQTASYIASVKGLPIIKRDKLKEINGGMWENMPWAVLPEKWPEEYYLWDNRPHLLKMPDGESMVKFQHRIIDEFQYIIGKNKGKSICAVTHGTAIKTIMCHFYNCSLEEMINIPWYDNTAVTIIECENGTFNILTEGDTSHLSNDMKTIENQDWWVKLNEHMCKKEDASIESDA